MNVPGWIATPTVSEVDSETDRGRAPGVEGNTRLTSATGMVLLVLLAVEGVTILSVRQMITLHIVVGVLLLGPVLLKTGSTMYRFTRYYTGAASYRRKGPPHPLLRVLGPLVILSSLALLGTGIALIVVGTIRVRRLADGPPDMLLDLGRSDDGACARSSVGGGGDVLVGNSRVVARAGAPRGAAGVTPPSSSRW